MKLSILTATYNREKFLKRLYKSILSNQTKNNMQIEWIIVDDGSKDRTKEIIQEFIKDNKIEIKYIKEENSGKMVAINAGVQMVTGDIVVDCDSDDFFTKDAFQIIENNVSKLLEDKELYALCFLKQNTKGEISGNSFKYNNKSTMFDLYFKEEIVGEKILVFKTEIRKKFKHELEGNEQFITEARMYHKMDNEYKVLCINEIIEIGDYLKDGYTENIRLTFKNSPRGYYKYFQEILQKGLKGVKLKKKIYIIKHFVYFLILKILKD